MKQCTVGIKQIIIKGFMGEGSLELLSVWKLLPDPKSRLVYWF